MTKRVLLVALMILTPLSVASGVMPATWHHSTEADFAKGKTDGTTVSSRGEVSLTRAVNLLMPSPEAPAVIAAAAVMGDSVYAASGVDNVVYRITEGKAAKFAAPPADILTCLRADGESLLLGAGGKGAGVYRIHAGGAVELIWSEESVKYVWDIVPGPEGVLYVATGPAAGIYEVSGNNQGRLLFDVKKLAQNVLCLAVGAEGRLYAGTDQEGLVLEIDPDGNTGRVLLDAQEKEIAALVPGTDEDLYVATSDAARASKDGSMAPATTNSGRSDEAPSSEEEAGDDDDGEAEETSTDGAAESATPADTATTRRTVARPAQSSSGRPSGTRPSASKGNAIYRIRKDGIVEEVFRKPVAIFSMILKDGELIIATGNGGAIYAISLDGDVVRCLADTEAKQIISLAPWEDRIVFSTANNGSLGVLEADVAAEGTYLSPALDAQQIAQWGTVRLRLAPENSPGSLTVSTRSGNVAEPDDSTWSQWATQETPADGVLKVSSPPARFLQYRLAFGAADGTGPVVEAVDTVYQVGNLAPVVTSVTAAAVAKPNGRQGEDDGPKVYRQLAIKASDPNQDKLLFRIEFREMGVGGWIQIAEKLSKPAYVWDTRTVGDGRYELRVVASDAPTNPAPLAMETGRISEPVIVDNTAPEVRLQPAVIEGRTATLEGEAVDGTSRIQTIQYSVDSAEDWMAVLPQDGICDGSRESFRIQLPELAPGEHRVAVKAEDVYGNAGYASVNLTVGE